MSDPPSASTGTHLVTMSGCNIDLKYLEVRTIKCFSPWSDWFPAGYQTFLFLLLHWLIWRPLGLQINPVPECSQATCRPLCWMPPLSANMRFGWELWIVNCDLYTLILSLIYGIFLLILYVIPVLNDHRMANLGSELICMYLLLSQI